LELCPFYRHEETFQQASQAMLSIGTGFASHFQGVASAQ
jgi:hypothetical protein